MTLGIQLSAITTEGNGVTTSFDYPFLIPSAAYAVVIFTDAAGAQTTLTPSQYAISGLGVKTGGTVIYPLSGSPIPTGALLTIRRVVPLVQTLSIGNQGPTFAAVETEDDYQVMIDQQQQFLLDRTLQLNVSDVAPLPQLPPAVVRAGQWLYFDSNGNPTVAAQIGGNVPVAAAWQPVIASATTQAGLALIDYLAPDTGAVVRNLDSKLNDFVSIRDFGATGDGVTDDTAAIRLALAALPDGGGIYAPAGDYLVSGEIDLVSGQHLFGAGAEATRFIVGVTTGDIFVFSPGVAGTDISMSDFSMEMKAGLARVSGRYILNQTTLNGVIENFHLDGAAVGIQLDNAFAVVRDGMMRNLVPSAGVGILISDGNDHQICNVLMDNPGGDPQAGIQLLNTQGTWITDCDLIRCGNGLEIIPGNGQVVEWCFFSQVACDTCDNNGFTIQTSGTGVVYGLCLQNCWSSSAANYGFFINGAGGFIDGLYATNTRVLNNGLDGVSIAQHAKNIHFCQGLVSGNARLAPFVSDGIKIDSDVVGIVLDGLRIGSTGILADTQAAQIRVLAGAGDHIVITNCDVGTANTGIAFAATGTSNYISDNPGWRTANTGAGKIPAGASSANILHGLSTTPLASDVQVTPNTDLAVSTLVRYWVSAASSTTFTINANAAASADWFFGWSVQATIS